MIGIVTILIIVVFVIGVIVYLLREHKDEVKDIADISRHRKNKDVLLIDYTRVGRTATDFTHQYFRKTMTWSDDDEEIIFARGYRIADKWMDDLRYAGIKIYVRLHGFKMPQSPTENKITSSVLYNVYSSRSVNKFISGITKVNFATMDMKTIGILIPIVIGIALGMFYFLGR